jgi:hypothetical protein
LGNKLHRGERPVLLQQRADDRDQLTDGRAGIAVAVSDNLLDHLLDRQARQRREAGVNRGGVRSARQAGVEDAVGRLRRMAQAREQSKNKAIEESAMNAPQIYDDEENPWNWKSTHRLKGAVRWLTRPVWSLSAV